MTNQSSGPKSTAESWGLRGSSLITGTDPKNHVEEFNGVWGLKPDADLKKLTDTLAADWFVPTTMKLALIRTARWFVMKTQYFEGYSLVFVTQFDGPLSKYFDDFVLNGKENLGAIWGQCVGCPEGPDATARDIVEFIARGQIKSLAIYDAFPGLSYNQILRHHDWYEKTREFQREASKGGDLRAAVDTFFDRLNQQSPPATAGASVDTEIGKEWQYDDVVERVLGKH